jgi:SAM-dependent methyltransferase
MPPPRDGTGTIACDAIPTILAHEYFSKPMQALFRSYDLAVYNLVDLDFRRPAVDLGCGDGAFASVFCRSRSLDGFDLGSDLRTKSLRRASSRRCYRLVFSSDARALPIRTATVKFVLCNGVLCCIGPGHERALLEVARILTTGGQLLMTVPTPGFTTHLLPTRLFEHLGLPMLAALYSRRMNARNGHRRLAYLDGWRRELERVGLKIEQHVYYFARSEAIW